MSRIIKAYDRLEVIPFDFHEMKHGEQARRTSSGKAPEMSGEDHCPESEETIQKRLLEAERKAEELEKEAYESGYAQGQKDGFEYGQKSLLLAKERLEQLLKDMENLSAKVLQDYKDWLLKTAVAIARQIVNKELSLRPELLIEFVEFVLAEADETQHLTIYLNPSDLDLMKKSANLDEIMEQSDRSLTLKADQQLERGGCRAESLIQLLDASMEARFALIEEAMLNSEKSDDTSEE